MDLYQVLCIYALATSLELLWDSWLRRVGIWHLCLLWGCLFFCCVAMPTFSIILFTSSCILFGCIWLYSLRRYSFQWGGKKNTNENKQKNPECKQDRGREKLGRVGVMQTIIRVYCIGKKPISVKEKN